MGATAFIIVGSRPHITYGLPNPGYLLMLYENDAPSWELVPLYPELKEKPIIWIPTISGMLEDALVMIGVHVAKDEELRKLAREIFKQPLDSEIEMHKAGKRLEKLRKVARKVLQKYDIGLVIVPLEDSTILRQLGALNGYGDLWYSLNMPVSKREEYMRAFQEILDKLRDISTDKKKFEEHLKKLSEYAGRYKRMSDEEMYATLVQVVFFAGMNAKTVGEKMPTILKYLGDFWKVAKYTEADVGRIMKDKNMIKHGGKIFACIHNAKEFVKIVQKYGSFANYLDSFGVSFDDYEGIKNKIRPELIRRFKWIGPVTAYHYLMDLGFGVMKPDRNILRLFYRIGWLDSSEATKENIDRTVKICKEIADSLNLWIRVVDIVLVAFCMENGHGDLAIKEGICTNVPKCYECPVRGYCWYYAIDRGTRYR